MVVCCIWKPSSWLSVVFGSHRRGCLLCLEAIVVVVCCVWKPSSWLSVVFGSHRRGCLLCLEAIVVVVCCVWKPSSWLSVVFGSHRRGCLLCLEAIVVVVCCVWKQSSWLPEHCVLKPYLIPSSMSPRPHQTRIIGANQKFLRRQKMELAKDLGWR